MSKTVSLPEIITSKCLGSSCQWCVSVCPVDCLEMTGFLPWLPRPRDCISCSACEQICPRDAILMKNIEGDELKDSALIAS
jgi:formate hydrogenlyase subunit 6/NADH:ubiquinone oxidoreductase subunit I